MSRLATAPLAALLLAAGTSVALADPRADELADEAGKLMFTNPPQFEDAIELYKQALQLSPEPRFYFNLCVAYYSTGDFGLALQACDSVGPAGGDDEQMAKTAKMLTKVEDKIRALGRDPNELRQKDTSGTEPGGGTGDPGTGNGNGTGEPTGGGGGGEATGGSGGTGQPVDASQFRGDAPVSLFQAATPTHQYVWTVGGHLVFGGTGIGGNNYQDAAGGVRLHVDYMVAPKRRVGIQGYASALTVGPDEAGFGLSMGEVGAAAYVHARCRGRLCLTPLVGAHFVALQPGESDVQFLTLGARVEGTASLALGQRFEHVLSVQLGLTLTMPAVGGSDMAEIPGDYGLDRASTMTYLGLGYTHRFSTPFGQAPFITLE
jgi:hypothetical protein